MDQDEVYRIGAKTAEALLDARPQGSGREVVGRAAGGPGLADLRGEDVFTAALCQRLADALLAQPVGGGRVHVVDAQIEHGVEQTRGRGLVREVVSLWVLDPLVAADLEGAEPDGADGQAASA
jgi:hypothetical protein